MSREKFNITIENLNLKIKEAPYLPSKEARYLSSYVEKMLGERIFNEVIGDTESAGEVILKGNKVNRLKVLGIVRNDVGCI